MARNHLGITNTGRMEAPSRHFPKQILWVIILVSLAIGFSLLGLLQTLWQNPNPSISLPSNPQPAVLPQPVPTSSSTPTQSTIQPSVLMPTLEARWEEIKFPPVTEAKYGIAKISVENNGDTIRLYHVIGPGNKGNGARLSVWKTEDGGKIWEKEGEITLSNTKENEVKLVPVFRDLFKTQIIPSINLGVIPMGLNLVASDPNNSNNLLASVVVFEVPPPSSDMPAKLQEQIKKQRELVKDQKLNTHRIFVSSDAGKSWAEITYPPGKESPLDNVSLALISSGTYLNIYVGTGEALWQTKLDVKNPIVR